MLDDISFVKFPKTPRVSYVIQQKDIHKEYKHFNAFISEKLDGANCGLSFEEGDQNLLLQSRGHYLRGGPRERIFDYFKTWAYENSEQLFDILGVKYILFGEYLYAKHFVFYDALPSYFLAFDIYDKTQEKFLSTPKFLDRIKNSCIKSVPILYSDRFDKINSFIQYIKPTSFKTKEWKSKLIQIASEKELEHTDMTDLMEGVYVRIENDDWVVGRMKHPRDEFKKMVMTQESQLDDKANCAKPIEDIIFAP